DRPPGRRSPPPPDTARWHADGGPAQKEHPMPYTSLTPAKYAQQISRSALDAAEERVQALHRDPEADPRAIIAAEEDRDHARWEHDNTIPWANSAEDVDEHHESSTRVALDGGHADVDVFEDR